MRRLVHFHSFSGAFIIPDLENMYTGFPWSAPTMSIIIELEELSSTVIVHVWIHNRINSTKTDLRHVCTRHTCYFLTGFIPNNCNTEYSITKERNCKSTEIANATKYLYDIFGARNRTMSAWPYRKEIIMF
jgi:hypothetical protein